jgi:hypothetical protein
MYLIMCMKLVHNILFILFCQNKDQLRNGIAKLFLIFNNSPILKSSDSLCFCEHYHSKKFPRLRKNTYLHSMVREHSNNFICSLIFDK